MMPDLKISHAPWTDEEVACLEKWQACDAVHPFTSLEGEILIPTRKGWVCTPDGPVIQDWAHTFMVTFSGAFGLSP